MSAAGLAWCALPCGASTTWTCWYNMDQQVACVVHSAAPAAALTGDERQALDRFPATRQQAIGQPWAGTAPLKLLRERPGALRGRTMYIPLHNEPFDHGWVAELAQAVMCGGQATCRATYGERPAMTLESAADFADANDPMLAVGE